MSVPAHERYNAISLVDTGDFAFGMFGDLCIDCGALVASDITGSLSERHIDVKSALIDDGVVNEDRLLRRRQRRQCAVHQTREHGIALGVLLEEFTFFRLGLIPTD